MTTKAQALAEALPIIARLGKKFARWLIDQGLSLFKKKLQRSIGRLQGKVRRAARRHNRQKLNAKGLAAMRRLRAIVKSRMDRCEWMQSLLCWANRYHKHITAMFAGELYDAADRAIDTGLGLE